MKLYPFDECVTAAVAYIAAGHTIHQQFNCADCGTKQTIDEPNIFFTEGCCEVCGHLTDIRRDGCNYMLITTV